MRVAVGSSSFGSADPAPIRLLEEAGFQVDLNPQGRCLDEEEILRHVKGAVGLIAGLEPLTRAVMESARDLRAIARVGVGMENVDVNAAADLGIRVSNTPDEPAVAVAELTLAAALALSRKLFDSNEAMHQGRWEKVIGRSLAGATALVVGFGRIGRRVADLLSAFGAEVLVADPYLSEAPSYPVVALSDGLRRADLVSLHASGRDVLIGEPEFGEMKDGAILLNAARGGLVDEEALLDVLRSGRLRGAWFDVFWNEPYTGALQAFDQVLLTPHVATYTIECRLTMELAAARNLIRDLQAQ